MFGVGATHMYGETLLDHFLNPRHLGELPNADGTGTIGDPVCGDFLRVYLRVRGEVIIDISFLCQGCPAAIASGSATTELAFAKTIDDALLITEDTVSEYLGGLPGEKVHCSNLGVAALRYATADYIGVRKDRLREGGPVIERLRGAAKMVASAAELLDSRVTVGVKRLPPEAAIGDTAHRDYPIWKGKEGIVEARLLDSAGQAFSPVVSDFEGELGDVLAMDLEGTDRAAVANRAIFVSAANALCSHLGICSRTVHCKDEGPVQCAADLVNVVAAGSPEDSRIALIGCQPRMIEALSASYRLRVIDLDPENIGRSFGACVVEGEDGTDDVLNWCTIALVTGSTLVNGSIDRFVGLKCHTVFYGVTAAAAAALLRLPRFCPRATD